MTTTTTTTTRPAEPPAVLVAATEPGRYLITWHLHRPGPAGSGLAFAMVSLWPEWTRQAGGHPLAVITPSSGTLLDVPASVAAEALRLVLRLLPGAVLRGPALSDLLDAAAG